MVLLRGPSADLSIYVTLPHKICCFEAACWLLMNAPAPMNAWLNASLTIAAKGAVYLFGAVLYVKGITWLHNEPIANPLTGHVEWNLARLLLVYYVIYAGVNRPPRFVAQRLGWTCAAFVFTVVACAPIYAFVMVVNVFSYMLLPHLCGLVFAVEYGVNALSRRLGTTQV